MLDEDWGMIGLKERGVIDVRGGMGWVGGGGAFGGGGGF